MLTVFCNNSCEREIRNICWWTNVGKIGSELPPTPKFSTIIACTKSYDKNVFTVGPFVKNPPNIAM